MKLLLRTLFISICLSFFLLPAIADDKAVCINKVMEASRKLNTAKSFYTDFNIVTNGVTKVGFIEGLKPNYLHAELWTVPKLARNFKRDKSKIHEIYVYDGKTNWFVDHNGAVTSKPATKDFSNAEDISWISGFYNIDSNISIPPDSKSRLYHDVWHGKKHDIVEISDKSNTFNVKIYIGHDKLIHRFVVRGVGNSMLAEFPTIHFGVRLSPKDFIFHKPSFAHTPKSKIDSKAKEILTKVEQTYRSLNEMAASVINIQHFESIKRHRVNYYRDETYVKMMKPNYTSLDTYWETFNKKLGKIIRNHNILEVSDGDNLWRLWDFNNNYYEKTTCKKDGGNIIFFGGNDNLDLFYAGKKGYANTADDDPEIDEISYLGSGKWHGDLYEMISIKFNTSDQDAMYKNAKLTYVYYIGNDNIIHRCTHEYIVPGDSNMDTDVYIEKLDLHPNLTKSDFVFTPPVGAIEKIQFPEIQAKEKPLLSNGTVAPDFTVQDRNGKPLRLSDYRGKVVVLDFWSTWCGPCQSSLPSTNAVAEKYLKKNVVVIAVNVWDTKEAFDAWLPNHKTYDSIKFAIDPTKDSKDVASVLYNVSGIPTQYIIDKNGKIVKSIVGFSGTDEELVKGIEEAIK